MGAGEAGAADDDREDAALPAPPGEVGHRQAALVLQHSHGRPQPGQVGEGGVQPGGQGERRGPRQGRGH